MDAAMTRVETAASGAYAATFSTSDLPAPERFDSWRSRFGSVNEIEATPHARADFAAEATLWRLGPMVLAQTRAPARRILRSAAHCARDEIDHWVLRVTRTGSGAMRIGGTCEALGPGTAHIGHLGAPYVEDRTAGEWIGLFVPRGLHPELDAGLDLLGPHVAKGPTGALLADFVMSLAAQVQRAAAEDGAAMAEAARGMIAACLLRERAPRALRRDDRARLERLRLERLIRAEIGAPDLDAERLSVLSGLPRSSLYRHFEESGGVTAHIRRLRLELARLDLCDPLLAELTVARVAERRGFANAAFFSRAYGRAFGETPGATRRRAMRCVGSVRHCRSADADRTRDLAMLLR